MVSFNPPKTVDLFTHDFELTSWIHHKYPEKLDSEHYKVDRSAPGEKELFCFYNLDRSVLGGILGNIKEGYFEYDLRESQTGKSIKFCSTIDP